MNFNAFNVIDDKRWGQEAILDWKECDLLDQLQADQAAYSWGYTKDSPTGL